MRWQKTFQVHLVFIVLDATNKQSEWGASEVLTQQIESFLWNLC